MAFLSSLLQPFRFLSRYRLRQQLLADQLRQDRKEERDHQALLLKTFLNSLETIQEASAKESTSNSDALIAVAKSVAAQAQSFGEWMKCFQAAVPPTSSVVRDEDEYAEEQARNLEKGLPADMEALPPEMRLAWALKNDPNWLGQNELVTP